MFEINGANSFQANKTSGIKKPAFGTGNYVQTVAQQPDVFIKQSGHKNYFPYSKTVFPTIIPQKFEDIPTGSHPDIKDARNCDISKLNLSEEQLINLCIDKTTIMSDKRKAVLKPYIEKAKDPGLGIRDLHKQGITGKGIRMAIIDQALGKHEEYDKNVTDITDINCKELKNWDEASMHGAAVTSIAVGKNTGVAPDAKVSYYSAVNLSYDPKYIEEYKKNLQAGYSAGKYSKEFMDQALKNIAERGWASSNASYVTAINKILDNNKKLAPQDRVQVVSISWGFDNIAPDYPDLLKALERAKKEGVFILSTRAYEHYGMITCGANRDLKGDINTSEPYEAGAFWKKTGHCANKNKLLLVPMDHRTVGNYQDETSYMFCGNDGGMSWSTPWLAGMYVLAKQVDFNITPEKFWHFALKTSDECHNNDTNEYVGRLINPQKLIEEIKTEKDNWFYQFVK